MTTMTAAFQGFWKHIFDFKGRTTRKDYFLNVLWQTVWLGVLALLLALFSNNLLVHLSASVDNTGLSAVGVLFFVSVFAIAVPSLSLMVRHFNDIGLNYWGWKILVIVLGLSIMPFGNSVTWVHFAVSGVIFVLALVGTDGLKNVPIIGGRIK